MHTIDNIQEDPKSIPAAKECLELLYKQINEIYDSLLENKDPNWAKEQLSFALKLTHFCDLINPINKLHMGPSAVASIRTLEQALEENNFDLAISLKTSIRYKNR